MAGPKQPGIATIYGARIIFRNFKGKETNFNAEGDRNFGVILPDDVGEAMLADGWAVKRLKATEEEQDEGIEFGPYWLSVKVDYKKGRPPKIRQVTSRGPTLLQEENVADLDNVDIAIDEETGLPKVDLIVRPFFWEVGGRSGIKAYLQSMYITIEEDELEKKYAHLQESEQ